MHSSFRSVLSRPIGRLAVGVVAVAATVAVTLSAPPGGAPARGELVAAEHLRTLSVDEAAAELASDRWDVGTVRHGVDTYRLVYRTVDPQGRPTTASGLLALPRDGSTVALRTVSFTHGTELSGDTAPSVAEDVWGSAPALTYASAGFAAVAPDYLGLGVGPGPHPWKDVPSETTAALDMLRAARGFVPTTGRQLGPEVLVTGFSQGASTALGLARALQDGADEHFRLHAVAPISGGYDFRHAELPALLNGDVQPPKAGVVYAAYLIVAWDRLHGLYDEPGELIKPPYDRTVEELFDSEHSPEQILAGTPDDLGDLLTPRAVEMLRNPSGRLAEALRVDFGVCTGWTPTVPVRLYRVGDDVEAVPANTDNCQAALRVRGVDAPIVDVGTGGHVESNRLATAAVVRWFREF